MEREADYLGKVVSYIKNNLKKGYTKESLKVALIRQGHSKLEITRAFRRVEEELAREAPILKTKPKITYEIVEPKTDTSVKINLNKKSFWKRFFIF